MGVYIKGIGLPKENECAYLAIIYADGSVQYNKFQGRGWQTGKALSVPPRTDLVELGAVLEIATDWCPDDDGSVGRTGDLREMLDEIESLPIIIPPEEGE